MQFVHGKMNSQLVKITLPYSVKFCLTFAAVITFESNNIIGMFCYQFIIFILYLILSK